MHVYFVRHGETLLNRTSVHQFPSTPISELGREQIIHLSEYLKEINPDVLITSSYTRARESARIIGQKSGLMPEVSDLFCEVIRPSKLFGTTFYSPSTLWYAILSFLHRGDPSWRYHDAENFNDIRVRTEKAVTYLELMQKSSASIIVVSHTLFIQLIILFMCERKPLDVSIFFRALIRGVRMKNATVAHLECERTPKNRACVWRVVKEQFPCTIKRKSRMKTNNVFKNRTVRFVLHTFVITLLICAVTISFLVGKGRSLVHIQNTDVEETLNPEFPVSVDPARKLILENPVAELYFEQNLSLHTKKTLSSGGWFTHLVGKLALFEWYQNLASLSNRMLVIEPGERKEQVADHFGKILGWNDDEKDAFLNAIEESVPPLSEGKFAPGTYSVTKEASPAEVASRVLDRFDTVILSRYGEGVDSIVPLQDALIVASLLEREAYDFNDMRLISGVIWNRLFIDMRLQIDATLQYARGSRPDEPWWPKPRPADKYINSEYNTYKHEGLPPTPIANPSLDAILAALNPKKTDCMYYFHDKDAEFHCSETYKEHVALLTQYYGRGK